MRRGCVIFPTENTILSLVNNDVGVIWLFNTIMMLYGFNNLVGMEMKMTIPTENTIISEVTNKGKVICN